MRVLSGWARAESAPHRCPQAPALTSLPPPAAQSAHPHATPRSPRATGGSPAEWFLIPPGHWVRLYRPPSTGPEGEALNGSQPSSSGGTGPPRSPNLLSLMRGSQYFKKRNQGREALAHGLLHAAPGGKGCPGWSGCTRDRGLAASGVWFLPTSAGPENLRRVCGGAVRWLGGGRPGASQRFPGRQFLWG